MREENKSLDMEEKYPKMCTDDKRDYLQKLYILRRIEDDIDVLTMMTEEENNSIRRDRKREIKNKFSSRSVFLYCFLLFIGKMTVINSLTLFEERFLS